MSIKKLSETGFMETAEFILRQVAVMKKDTMITKKTSFREDLNMTSLDIAELIVGLEAAYGVRFGDWVNMNNVSNLADVYTTFVKGIHKKRQAFVVSQNAKTK